MPEDPEGGAPDSTGDTPARHGQDEQDRRSRRASPGGAGTGTGTGAADHRSAVRRMAWGTALAVAATAAMIAVTVPLGASGQDGDDGARSAGSSSSADGAGSEDPPGRIEEAPDPGPRGTGRDALTPAERARAEKIALSADTSLRRTSEDVRGKAGAPQHLSTELTEESSKRTAEVYFYDYADDSLVHKTVDLAADRSVGSQVSRGSQPPPAWAESREAASLLLKDPLGAGLRADFARATGKKLTDARQLGVQGLGYRPDGAAGDGTGKCGEQRCVRLFTRVAGGGRWIDTQKFVINLSDRSVHRLKSTGGSR